MSKIRKTSWQDAQTQFLRWGPNREFDEHCDSHKCSLKITLNEFVFGYLSERNLFVKLDDYFRWRLKLSYDIGPFARTESWLLRLYTRVGGRPARVIGNIGMRDGTVWSKGISIWVEALSRASSKESLVSYRELRELYQELSPCLIDAADKWISST